MLKNPIPYLLLNFPTNGATFLIASTNGRV